MSPLSTCIANDDSSFMLPHIDGNDDMNDFFWWFFTNMASSWVGTLSHVP